MLDLHAVRTVVFVYVRLMTGNIYILQYLPVAIAQPRQNTEYCIGIASGIFHCCNTVLPFRYASVFFPARIRFSSPVSLARPSLFSAVA